MKREDFSYLNGIKGISALVIIIYHYIHFTQFGAVRDELVWHEYIGFLYSYGHYAVDMFFIISGILFELNYSGKIACGEYSFIGFMKKRILRIWPLYILTTIITALLQWVLMAIREGYTFRHSSFYTTVLMSIFGIGTIGKTGGIVNGPAWQIEVLLLCYIVCFIGIVCTERHIKTHEKDGVFIAFRN